MELKLTKSGKRLFEEDLDAVESRYHLQLPADYREFLLTSNGGKPDRCLFRFKGKSAYTECIHYFLAMSDDNPNISFDDHFKTYKDDEKRLPDAVIPVAFDPGGNLICLAVNGKKAGTVYFWDHEEERSSPRAVERGKNLAVIADSFQEFIDDLKAEED